jgi:hypothetical protein
VSEGGLEPPRPIRALAPQASASAIPPPGLTLPPYLSRLDDSPSVGCPASRTGHNCTRHSPVAHNGRTAARGAGLRGRPAAVTRWCRRSFDHRPPVHDDQALNPGPRTPLPGITPPRLRTVVPRASTDDSLSVETAGGVWDGGDRLQRSDSRVHSTDDKTPTGCRHPVPKLR